MTGLLMLIVVITQGKLSVAKRVECAFSSKAAGRCIQRCGPAHGSLATRDGGALVDEAAPFPEIRSRTPII